MKYKHYLIYLQKKRIMNLLFIPELLGGNYSNVFIKLIIVFALWLVAVAATLIDLSTGIKASKRLGCFKTTSSGLRQTIKKDLQYFTILIIALFFDFVFSYLTTIEHVWSIFGIFKIPIFTITVVLIVLAIEFISIKENLDKGNKKKIVSPDLADKALEIIAALGDEKVKAIAEILKSKENEKDKRS